MADPRLSSSVSQPPPAPPLPPPPTGTRASGIFQRYVAPVLFSRQGGHETTPAQSSSASPREPPDPGAHPRRVTARGAVHKTGIAIAAIDINEAGTHAVLAGKDILRTVKVQDRNISQDLDIRQTVNSYISTHSLRQEDLRKKREYLPAKDVAWSHKHYSHVVATAAQNGRIALYDVSGQSSRVELTHLYQHDGEVHKIDFDPHLGYMLLSGSQDKSCKIWDIRDPKRPRGYAEFNVRAPVRNVRWSPADAMEFALCTEDGTVQKWDIRHNRQPLLGIRAHEKACYSLSWHPDGKHIVTGGLDKLLKVWDFKSDNRRQKPVFQLRCPAGIMSLAWRPACWSAEFAERGTWQSTQIATCYTDEDPRIHVWDLRRPLIPFRELNQYDTRPMDLLWASKDLLWTVGGQGIFAQNDMSFAAQPEDSLPPGAITWAPDGTFYAVTEDRSERHNALSSEPAALFLNVPPERLSGADEALASRSLTDDEAAETSLSAMTGRRISKTLSRSAKSQTSTPPHQEDSLRVLNLDRAVQAKKDLFVNGQMAAFTRLPAVFTDATLVERISECYARPMSSKEREAQPDQILPRLKAAFDHNFVVAHTAGLREEANQWSTLRDIIVPELQTYADNRRRRRIISEAQQEEAGKQMLSDNLSPFTKHKTKSNDVVSPGRSDKIISNLFKGVVDSKRGGSDSGSQLGSNLTTPRQHPIASSAAPIAKQAGSTWFTMDDAIESMQPLPPSLAHAHSTAATASQALRESVSNPSDSPPSSPENTKSSPEKSQKRSTTHSTAPSKEIEIAIRSPLHSARTQEQRRAALRDYRAPTRQPLTLEGPSLSPSHRRVDRHDSAESFAMFPASASSSGRDRSLGRRVGQGTPAQGGALVPWAPTENLDDSLGHSEGGWGEEPTADPRGTSAPSQTADFDMDDSPFQQFGLDGASDSKPIRPMPVEQKFGDALARSPRSQDDVVNSLPKIPSIVEQNMTSLSTSQARMPAARDFDSQLPFTHRVIPQYNPFLRGAEGKDFEKLRPVSKDDPSMRLPYDASDFRPIDITTYLPEDPWSLTAFPMLACAIDIDSSQGKACSMFSVHLISLVHPFFFHQTCRVQPTLEDLQNAANDLSLRLQHPAFRHRIFQGIFLAHSDHLANLQLPSHAQELRKRCVEEFDYPSLATVGSHPTRVKSMAGEQLNSDSLRLKATCSSCKQPLANLDACRNCRSVQDPCPICELPLSTNLTTSAKNTSTLTTYCHACGHTTHLSCMKQWLSAPDVEGECPTPFCGCDCAPGSVRDRRVAQQIVAREEQEAIKGSKPGVKKDPSRADVGPAVAKTREALREKSVISSGSHPSVDEKTTPNSGGSAWSKKGTSASVGRGALGRSNSGSTREGNSVGTSLGRRVRVVEPEAE